LALIGGENVNIMTIVHDNLTHVQRLQFGLLDVAARGSGILATLSKSRPSVGEVVGIAASLLTIITASAIVFDWIGREVAVVGSILTVIVSAAVVLVDRRREGEFQLFLCDEKGFPRTDIAIESPTGTRYADEHGKVTASTTWNGQEVTIHDVRTWRLLGTATIDNKEKRQIVKVVVKDKNGKKKR